MCTYTCTCLWVFICTVRKYGDTLIFTCVRTYVLVHSISSSFICLYVRMCMYVSMYVCTYLHILYVQLLPGMCTISVLIYVCMYVCTQAQKYYVPIRMDILVCNVYAFKMEITCA